MFGGIKLGKIRSKIQLPKRKLGKTGVEVPCLALGSIFNTDEHPEVLEKAIELGVTYWDTADCYCGGRSEIGIGNFLGENPDIRKNIFLVTKSCPREPDEIQKTLERSLDRLKTDYINLYFIHGLDDPEELNEDIKAWAEKAKKANKIRFFGFSTHKNMPLKAAAKLDWIDAIMTTYNFRLMQYPEIQAGVEACYKAGIGLVAMKTQAVMNHGSGPFEIETEEDKKLTEHFLKRGFTPGQAKIKAVLQDKRISAASVGRGNFDELIENVAGVLDKTKLTQEDMRDLKEYAAATASDYCAGCAKVCDAALPEIPYVSEIMRCLMYHNGYGEREHARDTFLQIPSVVRSKLLRADYSRAEAVCPQKIQISEKVVEAVGLLA